MKILITGGHLSPALAVIEELTGKFNIVFVGRENEKSEISKKNIPFYELQTGRFTRILDLQLILNFLKIPLGFIQAFSVLLKEKPGIILSFGGYIAFPVCLVGSLLRIPVYIHEQTAKPGLTNRSIGLIAKKIFVSFAETKKYFPAAKTIVTGNPVRKAVLHVSKKPYAIKKTKPVIYITGGSLGSQSINLLIKKILEKLLDKYILIQQTGNNYQNVKPLKVADYYVRDHFAAEELGYIYSVSDLVIGRSGANTLFELIAWKKPAILIPLPWSANQEQLTHAQILQKSGAAEIFLQSESPDNLLPLINKVMTGLDRYKNNFKNVELLYHENAAKTIVETILAYP